MITEQRLPRRAARISEEQVTEICRLDLRGLSQVEIAGRVGVHRNTVHRVLARVRPALAVTKDLSAERARALAVYLEIQRAGWEAYESAQKRGRSPAMVLSAILASQARIDTLLGLAATSEDSMLQLQRFKTIVLSVITAEAPELGAVIAQRLLEARSD